MAKVNWTIVGAGNWGLSIDTPSGTGKSMQIAPVLHFFYKDKTNIINPEVIWWTKLSWGNQDYGEIILRSQNTADINNCYLFVFQGGIGYFYKVVAGAYTLLSNVALSGMTSWKKFRVRVKNNDFTLERWDGANWILILTAKDTASKWAVGASGFGGWSASAPYVVYFDDVDVGEEIP